MPLSAGQIRDLVAFGREQSGVEFKSTGPRKDPVLRAKVIRAMLAMANRRDGGSVIIGVKESSGILEVAGLTSLDALTWNHDSLADSVAEYADPRVVFDSYTVEVDGQTTLVIEVEEFTDAPVVCKRTYNDGKSAILRQGAVYVRSNRKPESREVANYDEMRELLDIATDKGVRRFVSRARAAGLGPAAFGHDPASGGADERAVAAFRAERGEL